MFECLISRSVASPHLVKCSILNWCLTSFGQMGVKEATTAPTNKNDFRSRLSVFRLFHVVRSERSVFFHLHGINSFNTKLRQPKEDLRLWARVLDRTSYLKISRRYLTDNVIRERAASA